MTRARVGAIAVAGALALGGESAAAAPAPLPAAPTVTIATTGAWCWFADPRAIAYRGRAVFGWVAGDGSIMVGDDLGRRFALDPRLQRDDHDNPAFYVRRDGRLMAFWSAHNGSELRYRTATDGIGAWGPIATAPANPAGGASHYTYPNPIRVGSTLFLFWSGAATTATFATSPDDGASWSRARTLFDPAGPRVRYVKYRQAGGEIHLAWTLGHPREGASGVYHAIIRGQGIYRQDGTAIGRLGVPISPTGGDLVYAPATAGGAWVHDLVVQDGRPTIVYATFPTAADHRYRVARWDGRWIEEQLAVAGPSFEESGAEPSYSGGIALDPADPGVAYLSRRVGAQFELERAARTLDGWSLTPLTHDSPEPNVRPFPVAGGLAWMRGRYPGYTSFRTALAWRPGATTAPAAATGVRIASGSVARDRQLRIVARQRTGILRIRVVRPTTDGRIAIAGEARARLRRGTATVVLPRLPAGRYRVSAWQADERLTWRHVRIPASPPEATRRAGATRVVGPSGPPRP